jgi:hypothetical protein
MLRISICTALLALPLFAATGFAGDKKSWQECHDLAVARGLARTSSNAGQRYQTLKAAGHTTHPTGFIARCMAGIQD